VGLPDEEGGEVWPAPAGVPGGVRRFAADEMVACAECARANPPTRMNCLYCGARLPVLDGDAEHLRPTLRRLEEWENGYNVVVEPRAGQGLSADAAARCAAFLKLEPEQFAAMLTAALRLPLARAASVEEAELIVGRLKTLGLATFVVGDEELKPDESPRRASALELTEETLAARFGAGGERVEWHWSELVLFISGRLISRRVEVEERQGRLGSHSEMVEARELAADEAVLDLYVSTTGAGLRILAGRFDYSCLGAGKGLLARDNFASLVGLLRARAPQALFDDAYPRVRHLLSIAWPPTEKTESGGLRRDRPGRFNTEAVTIVSNEAQFTRYSRLRRYLAQRERSEAI
jgi:hypothetical protein